MPAALVSGPVTLAQFEGQASVIAINDTFEVGGQFDHDTLSWMLEATTAFNKRGNLRPTENLAQLMAILFAVQHVRMNSVASPSQALVEIMSTAFQTERSRAEIEAQTIMKVDSAAPAPPIGMGRSGDPKRVKRTKEPIHNLQTGEIFAGLTGAVAIVGLNERWAALSCNAPRTPWFRIDPIEHFIDLREYISNGPTPYIRTHREAFPDLGFSSDIIRQATASV